MIAIYIHTVIHVHVYMYTHMQLYTLYTRQLSTDIMDKHIHTHVHT